jgi:hypothetical protein
MKHCNICNETKPLSEFFKANTKKAGYQYRCKSCATSYRVAYKKTKRGHLSSYLSDSKQRAKEKNLPFDLDLKYLESITTDACPIFKTPFDWGRDSKGQGNERPSLDRIIPELGYVKGNVAFISMWANSIKQDATEKELYAVADWIHERRKYVTA